MTSSPISPLDNVVLVLDRTKDVINIAGVVRVMMNMGLSRLRLVRPDEFDIRRIDGVAHRSGAIVERVEFFDTLADAVADAVYVVGTSARARADERNTARPRAIAPAIVRRAAEGPVAILFGREDKGLPTEALDLCHEVIGIPTSADHHSLNLAQATLVVCYELLLATDAPEHDAAPPGGKKTRKTPPATHAEVEQMYGALAAGLERIDFFEPREAPAVMRTLRTIFSRAELTLREARQVGAIGFQIGNYLDKAAARKAAASRDAEDSAPE